MSFIDFEKIFEEQICADFHVELGSGDRIIFAPAVPFDGRARTHFVGTPFFNMTYFGDRLLVVADKSIMAFAKQYVYRATELFRVFDAPNVFALNAELEKYGYAVGSAVVGMLPSTRKTEGISTDGVRMIFGHEIAALYSDKTFTEALCYSTTARRRDTIAAVYYDGEVPTAVAACTNDAEKLWQIGVDVKPEYRRRGIGSALVRALKDEIINRGACPYYCRAFSNFASEKTAHSAGFSPYFVELSATVRV